MDETQNKIQTKALAKIIKDMKGIKEQLDYLTESMEILVKLELDRQKK